MKSQTLHVTKAVRSDEAIVELLAAVASADLIVLSFPLYVDSLPGPAIRALELIAARRGAVGGATDAAPGPAFVAICQSGFPEAEHSTVAIEICRNFASSAGLEWAGGLVMPEGGMLGGQPMSKMKDMLRSAVARPRPHGRGTRGRPPGARRGRAADGEAGVPSRRLPVGGQLGLALAG